MREPVIQEEFGLKTRCLNETNTIWESGFNAIILYDDEKTSTELHSLGQSLEALYFKTALSPFRTESYVEEVNKRMDNILELMQENLYTDISTFKQ